MKKWCNFRTNYGTIWEKQEGIHMDRILIADPSEELCAAISEVLRDKFELRTCRNGLDAQQLLAEFRPNAIVLELRLCGLDGLALLERMDPQNRPAVLVHTAFCTDYVERRLQMLCDYVMYKPGNLSALADRITDMLNLRNELPPVVECSDPGDPVDHVLRQLINRTWRSGYKYLLAAARLYIKNPNQAVTKELYPDVARQFGTTGQCVERAIRSAIHQAWIERDEAIWRQFFPTDRTGCVCCPTNTAFLSEVAHHLNTCCRQHA